MSETDETGYGESPDTTDGPVEVSDADPGEGAGTTLTTDDEAQEDDSVMRPGNAAD